MVKRLAGRFSIAALVAVIASLLARVDIATKATYDRLQRVDEAHGLGLSWFDAWQFTGMPISRRPAMAGGAPILEALSKRKDDLVAEGSAILAIESDKRTDEQRARLAALTDKGGLIDQVLAETAAAAKIREGERALIVADDARIEVGKDRAADRPFESLGEQLAAIAQAGMPGGSVDPRLSAGPSGGSTQQGADGGFLIQKDFTTALLDKSIETAVLAPLCFDVPIGPNADGVEAPFVNETSRATGSRWGGVQVYRRAEADAVSASRPKLGKLDLRLEDLMGLAYVTDRLLQDATALGAIYEKAFTSEFAFKLDNEIFRGGGAGECLGVLNSENAALVSVAKETGQAAATINATNLSKMWARLPARSQARALWFGNVDVQPQLDELSMPAGTGALPCPFVRWSADATQLTIKGRPIRFIEQAETLGTKGDIVLLDLSEYLLIRKGDVDKQESMHVRFIYNERTFRWVARVNGRPIWHSSVTPFKGSAAQSPYISLDTRA